MATPSTNNVGKKKSKFKFKNGLKKFKKKVKKNDTLQHFTGTKQNSISNDNDLHTKKKKNLLKKKKKEKPRLPKLKLSEYKFPTVTIVPPAESWGQQQYDQEDRILHEYLKTKYQNEIYKLKFFPSDIILRFTLSQRGLKPFNARKTETENNFKTYLKYHYKNHYDDILSNDKLNCNKSLSALKTEVTALPLFIYGQDKQGHPIFWDDGSAYSKNAQLDEFKNDMKRVGLFRSRVMKRMHNIKLAASQRYGAMIYKHCLVMDLDNFNSKQFFKDRKFHEQNTKDVSDLFPEVLHRLYIINAPWAFRSAWKVIQTFLHPITVEKTKILGNDYIDTLGKDIDLDMIPYRFGGIGPWEVVYGAEPLSYPLRSCDNDFEYNALPKQRRPLPPRSRVPDMNKHKKKMEKQMKESGITTAMQQYEANNATFCIEEDEEEKNDFDGGKIVGKDKSEFQTQSAPNLNASVMKRVAVGDEKEESIQ